MFVIGITGRLGSGKSTVASLFAKEGARVLNADKVAHELLQEGTSCYKKVVELFGQQIVSRGCIDRKKLAGIVFRSKTKLNKLMAIIHPEVTKVFKAELKKHRGKRKVIILDVPLLFESGQNKLCDITIVVKANKQICIDRAAKNLEIIKAEALRRMNMQMPQQKKIRLADIVINNNQIIQTRKQVKHYAKEYFER